MLVSPSWEFRDVFDERPLECPVENFLLVPDKGSDAFRLQQAYGAGAEVDHLFVPVGHPLVHDAPADALSRVFIKEAEKQVGGLLGRQELELVRVFNVHDLVTDVVCSLHQISQRVSDIADAHLRTVLPDDAQFVCYLLIRFLLRGKEAELAVLPCIGRAEGVLHDTGERAVGHDEAPLPPAQETVREQTEGVGVALEVGDVVPEAAAHILLQTGSRPFDEECLDGLLAAVTERRIPHVVRIAGCLYDRADLFEERPAQLRMDFRQFPCYVIAQRLAQ